MYRRIWSFIIQLFKGRFSAVKTATFIRTVPNWRGNARLYKLSVPMTENRDWENPPCIRSYDFVVVSAIIAPYSGPETYIFGAHENGEVGNYSELDGSFRGELDHAKALRGAGYEIKEQ